MPSSAILPALVRAFDRYARIGVAELPRSDRSRRYAFNGLCLIATSAAVFYGLFYLAYGALAYGGFAWWPAWVVTLAFLGVWFLPRLARRSEVQAAVTGFLFVIVCFSLLTWMLGAPAGLHLFMLLGAVELMVLRAAKHPVETGLAVAAIAVAMVVCEIAFPEPAGFMPVDAGVQRLLAVSVLINATIMAFAVIYLLTRQVARAEARLEAEHARSEALLRNLLPESIAAQLKTRPGRVIAEGLPAVTLLFADIVDFTPRSARMSPEDLVSFLNRIFSEFDAMSEARGLEKIKTIGDAYMVAAGLPAARADHAEVVADMALDMQAAAARLRREMGDDVSLRIGIHTGPAVAGVIGTSKVFYDVWGDTVNTASRMESHGEPGRIQVTSATRELHKRRYAYAPRGPVEIKGIGEVETWWLTGPAVQAARAC